MNMLMILGGGWQQLPTIEEFKKLGYEIALVDPDMNCAAYTLADIYYEIDIKDHEKIYERIVADNIENKILDILAINNEAGQFAALEIEKKIRSNNSDNISQYINIGSKDNLKKLLKNMEPNADNFYLVLAKNNVNEYTEKILKRNKDVDLIVKPVDGAGSRGVTRLRRESNSDEVNSAINLAIKNSDQEIILIEDFIFGKEYSVEVINSVRYGVFIASISKRYMLDGVSAAAIESIEYDSKTFDQISKYIEKFIHSIRHTHGLLHVELIIDEKNKINIIDIGQRGGGYWVADKIASDSIGMNLNVCIFCLKHGIDINLNIVNKNIKLLVYEREYYDKKINTNEYYLLDSIELKPNTTDDCKNSDSNRKSIKYFHKKNILSSEMIQERSDTRVNVDGYSEKAVGWSSRQQQELRFLKIIEQININKTDSILDLGCGFGDFLYTLHSENVVYDDKNYTGIDISKKMLDLAIARNVDAKFLCGNFMSYNFASMKFDHIICSGALNYSKKDPIEYIEKFISKFTQLCDKSLSFNLITSNVDYKDPLLEYYDSVEILKIIQKNVKKFKIDCSYNLHEFTCTLFK